MQSKTSWLISATVGTVVGAVSLVGSVKRAALRPLEGEGELREMQAQHVQALQQINETIPNLEKRNAIATENKAWRDKVHEVARAQHVDTLRDAWKSLPAKERVKSVAFAAGTSVVAGGATLLLTHPRFGRRGHGEDDEGFFSGWTGGDGGHHHTDGGHHYTDGGHHSGGFFDGLFDGGDFDLGF